MCTCTSRGDASTIVEHRSFFSLLTTTCVAVVGNVASFKSCFEDFIIVYCRTRDNWIGILKHNILTQIGRTNLSIPKPHVNFNFTNIMKNVDRGTEEDSMHMEKIRSFYPNCKFLQRYHFRNYELQPSKPTSTLIRVTSCSKLLHRHGTHETQSEHPSCSSISIEITYVVSDLCNVAPIAGDIPKNTDQDAWKDDNMMNLHFNLDYDKNTTIAAATLRLHRIPRENLTDVFAAHDGGCDTSQNEEEKLLRVSIYWYTKSVKRHRRKCHHT